MGRIDSLVSVRRVSIAGKGTFQVRILGKMGKMGNMYIDAPGWIAHPASGISRALSATPPSVPGFSSLQTRGRRGPTGQQHATPPFLLHWPKKQQHATK